MTTERVSYIVPPALLVGILIVDPPGRHGLYGPKNERAEIIASSMVPLRKRLSSIPALILNTHNLNEETTMDSDDSPFMLDDDPFADLSHTGSSIYVDTTFVEPSTPTSEATQPPAPGLPPRSPLSASIWDGTSMTIDHTPLGLSRTTSTGARMRPAQKTASHKPAFSTRPSLPSLHSLAKMHLTVPRKARTGKPGAGLPYEPWNDATEGELHVPHSPSILNDPVAPSPPVQLTPEWTEDLPFDDESVDESDSYMDLPSLTRDSSDGHSCLTQSSSMSSDSHSSYGEDLEQRESTYFDKFSYRRASFTSESGADVLETLNESDADESSILEEDDRIFESPVQESPVGIPFPRGETTPSPELVLPPISSSGSMRSSVSTIGRTLKVSICSVFRALSHVHKEDIPQEAMDGAEREQGSSRGGQRSTESASGQGRGYQSSSGAGASGSHLQGGSGGSGSGRGDEGNNGNRRPSASSTLSSSDSEDTSDDESDDYGSDNSAQPSTTRSAATTESDDDVPLATRIPTALVAQKTIRKQVHDERDQRRKDRLARHAAKVAGPSSQSLIGSQEASMHAARSRSMSRPSRVATLVPNPLPPMPGSSKAGQFALEDLNQRLKQASVAPIRRAVTREPSPAGVSKQPARSRTHEPHAEAPQSSDAFRTAAKTLTHMRSFHREPRKSPDATTTSQPLGRSGTTSRPRADTYGALVLKSQSLAPPLPELDLAKRSLDQLRRPSGDQSDGVVRSNTQRPPMPPLPAAEVLAAFGTAASKVVVQQRIFIADMQRYHMVEIGPATTAQNVLDTITAQGALDNWRGAGGWMLYEVAQDFGMERPIRDYELLSDVSKPWNKDKLVNAFMIKMTPLASTLGRKAIPTSSPRMSGYVEWEQKRGKWTKRWLELREHSLWLSKKDNGKDDQFLCSVSNFDAYVVTRPHKSPKPYNFAIKSTDSLTMFESAADYVHVFSCAQKDGERWVEAVMLARSYVIHQNQQVLATTITSPPLSAGFPGGLARAGTRKYSDGRAPPPLVSVPPPFTLAAAPSAAVFEPGSLLAKRAPTS